MGRVTPMLRCLENLEVYLILDKVHEVVRGRHIDGITLVGKILRVKYYRPNMLKDNAKFLNLCEKCQRFSNFIHASVEILYLVTSPWTFYK